MRKLAMTFALFLGLASVAGAGSRCLAADNDLKLSGSFVWEKKKGQNHNIKAVFTPDGDKKWKIVFTFDWGKGPQTWNGSATGDLVNGDIKGEGLHPDGHRKFTFSGTAKDGKIDCTHNETTAGRAEATGTMTLKKD
jgi:hypothetical protein